MKTAAVSGLQPGGSNGFLRLQARAFQTVFQAMACPGRIVSMGLTIPTPEALNSASAAICMTWLNTSTPFWTDIPWDAPAVHWIQNYSEATLVTEPSLATLALITAPATMPPLNQFRIGDFKTGSISATVIIQVNDLNPLVDAQFSGQLSGLPADLPQLRQTGAGQPGPGADILFTFKDSIFAPCKSPG